MVDSVALIVGAGDGLSASLARLLSQEGYRIVLAARNVEKLAALAEETNATTFPCDAASPEDVAALFERIEGSLQVVIYNPSARVMGPITDLDPEAVHNAIDVTAYGSFLVGQQAARVMLAAGEGTILFTGASAGVKGFPKSATFAMGKFAQRGLAESMARELHPQNIHVAWINVDGGIRNPGRTEAPDRPDSMLDPDAIARTYLDLIRQDRSAWSNEVTVRPWVERF